MHVRFDRGTLVLDHVAEGLDPERFLGASWDAELAAWRAPANRLSELRGRLAAKNVRFTDTLHPPALASTWSLPPLRWYQQAAVSAWRDSGDRGVIVLPTGSGKTVVALAAIAALGVATLVLVPTRVLLDQWARALGAAWPHPIGRLGDGEHSVAPITVSTYASAIAWAPRIGDRFGLVIVDEAHHVGAWCPSEILEMLIAPARLGLTATPPGAPNEWSLARQIGPTVYSLGIEALRGTALADFDHELITVELESDERKLYRRLRGEFSAFYTQQQRSLPGMAWREFMSAAQRSLAGRDALAAWRGSRALLAYPAAKRTALRELLERHAGDRILIFTADNATAYAIARELLVVPITCDIGRTERSEMLDRFRSGECSVLVSSQVLDEGFDVPDAEVAIVVGGTASQRRHAQRIGRVLRPRPDKRAAVYELVVADSAEQRQVHGRRGELRAPARPTVLRDGELFAHATGAVRASTAAHATRADSTGTAARAARATSGGTAARAASAVTAANATRAATAHATGAATDATGVARSHATASSHTTRADTAGTVAHATGATSAHAAGAARSDPPAAQRSPTVLRRRRGVPTQPLDRIGPLGGHDDRLDRPMVVDEGGGAS